MLELCRERLMTNLHCVLHRYTTGTKSSSDLNEKPYYILNIILLFKYYFVVPVVALLIRTS